MKKIALLSLALVLSLGLFAKKTQAIPKIILIGIGEKNPTFDEGRYPNLAFYYTPNLVSQAQVSDGVKAAVALTGAARETFSGEPKFISDANDAHELKSSFMLFDKNGVCYSQGWNIGRRGGYLKTVDTEGKSLEDSFKETMDKDKVAKENKKEMKIKKDDFMLGQKMPKFNISTPDGAEISITSLTAASEPVLIIFFQLPKDLDVMEMYESGEGKTSKQYGKAVLAGSAGSTVTSLCESIESEFFQYDARIK